jgi:biotin operon repressor
MRKDVREFIRRLEAAGLTVEPTPGHYRVLRARASRSAK